MRASQILGFVLSSCGIFPDSQLTITPFGSPATMGYEIYDKLSRTAADIAEVQTKCGTIEVTREQKFSVLQGDIDGHPLLAIIDKSLYEYESKASFPWFLSISIPLIDPTKEGLPTSKDSLALNACEDLLESTIAAECRFVYVGHVTWNGSREVLYYVDKPDALNKKLKNFGTDGVSRPFAFHCERDEKWDKISVYFKQQS